MKKDSKTNEELDLTRSETRWALARAGGWAGYYGPPIRIETIECPVTGEQIPIPIRAYKDTRKTSKACYRGLTTCYTLGCNTEGKCIGKEQGLENDFPASLADAQRIY